MLLYTYGLLVVIPYSGFSFSPATGEILQIYVLEQTTPFLRVGDVIVSIDSVGWDEYLIDWNLYFFENIQPGEVVEVQVMREDGIQTIPWIYTGFSVIEFTDRLFNILWLAFVFWFIGISTQFFMRPNNTQLRLFIAANYLLSLFITFGSVSAWHLWGSSILLHVVTWLILPVSIQFHWIFPTLIGHISKKIWVVIYTLSFGLAVAEQFQLLPRNLDAVAFLIALLSSILLLLFRFALQRNARREVILLSIAGLLAMLPIIVNSFLVFIGTNSYDTGPVTTLSLPVLPGVYFYILNRNRMAGLGSRVSRFITIYIFLVLLGTILLFVARYVSYLEISNESVLLIALFIALLTALMAILIFPSFQTIVEQRLLGVSTITYRYSNDTDSDHQETLVRTTRKLRVFLCHSSSDKIVVREIYHWLAAKGWIDPWLDEERLLPGQDWDMEIEKAVDATDAVIVCLSNRSINKEGYIQKEIRKVLDVSDQKPDGIIFLIPLRLENCEVPKRLNKWQWVNYFEENAYERIERSLIQRLKDLEKNSTLL